MPVKKATNNKKLIKPGIFIRLFQIYYFNRFFNQLISACCDSFDSRFDYNIRDDSYSLRFPAVRVVNADAADHRADSAWQKELLNVAVRAGGRAADDGCARPGSERHRRVFGAALGRFVDENHYFSFAGIARILSDFQFVGECEKSRIDNASVRELNEARRFRR